MQKIVAVCKDTGGFNAIFPVIELLKDLYQIHWIAQADGRAKDMLKERGCEFKIYNSSAIDTKDVVALVSSTCSLAGQLMTPDFKKTCPVILVQDQWTAGINDVWTDSTSRPNYVLVNDWLDKDIFLSSWPEFRDNQVIVTGYPALDKYASVELKTVRGRTRKTLGIEDSWKVVLFSGQWWHSGHALNEVVQSLNYLRLPVCLIARPHPAMKDNSPEEVSVWENALQQFKFGKLISDSSVCNISDVIAASDLVVSMFSTTLMEAAVLRIPNIAVLYPGHGLKLYKEVANTEEYPLVELGCCLEARDRDKLCELISLVLSFRINIRTNQERVFKLDGKNSTRAAQFIDSVISKI